jgi:hypothetical protein
MLKDELEAIIASDNDWSTRSTLVLAIGILGEYVVVPYFEHANITLVRTLFRSQRATVLSRTVRRCAALFKFLFAFMVVAGVIGEYGFSSRIARKAGELQRIADVELAEANRRAEQATILAGNIGNRADKLAALLKTEQRTTAQFQKQATIARLALEKGLKELNLNVRRRGSRANLVGEAHIENDLRLRPFKGQIVLVVFCTQAAEAALVPTAGELEQEQIYTALRMDLAIAEWSPEMDEQKCSPRSGLEIMVDPTTRSTTRRAAEALASVLQDALLYPGVWPVVEDRIPLPSLWAAGALDTIFVMIAENPIR